MLNIFMLVLKCTFFMSVLTLIYVIFLPLISKKYDAKLSYHISLLLMLGWLIPFRPSIVTPLPQTNNLKLSQIVMTTQAVLGKQSSTEIPVFFSFWNVAAIIWLLGIISIFIYRILHHKQFMKIVNRWSEPVENKYLLRTLDDLVLRLNVNRPVELLVCPGIHTPMLIGFVNYKILLPVAEFSSFELEMIMRHELTHLKRGDIWWRTLMFSVELIHWFNPVVYLMGRTLVNQCEISCDARVLKGADSLERQQYGKMILDVIRIGHSTAKNTDFSTNFYGEKRNMKKRILSILNSEKKKAGSFLLLLVCGLVIVTGTSFVTAKTTPDTLTETMLSDNDGKQVSLDGGETWISNKEYQEQYETSDIRWWTYEEYKAWLAKEKVALAKVLGEPYYYVDKNGVEQKNVWTKALIDETIASYEETLANIKKGMKVSASEEGDDNTGFVLQLDESSQAEPVHSAVITLDNGKEKDLGVFSSASKRLAAVKEYCNQELQKGNLSKKRVAEIIASFS